MLLNVEVLEDNEILTIEKARHVSRIADPKNRATLEKFDVPAEVKRPLTSFPINRLT